MKIEMAKRRLDILKSISAGVSFEDILSALPKEQTLVLAPQERGCSMIRGTAVKGYRPQQIETPLSSAASVGLTVMFKPLKLSSAQEHAEFIKKNTIPRAEKIDYTNKPRSTKSCFLDFVPETSNTNPKSKSKKDSYDLDKISALMGLSIVRKKPGEYHFDTDETDQLPSSKFSHK